MSETHISPDAIRQLDASLIKIKDEILNKATRIAAKRKDVRITPFDILKAIEPETQE